MLPKPPARPASVASRNDKPPSSRPTIIASANAPAVASVVAIRNGGLLSSENGVLDMMPNSSAGNDTYSRKKFIQASPDSGSLFDLPQANPMKITPKYGSARLRISTMAKHLLVFVRSNQAAGGPSAARLIQPFAPSIGHNHGLFDDL